jgi:hypothetical protein
MQFSKNTSTRSSKSSLFKIVIILGIIIGAIGMLARIDFPSPNKEIKKTISNEKLKIVK